MVVVGIWFVSVLRIPKHLLLKRRAACKQLLMFTVPPTFNKKGLNLAYRGGVFMVIVNIR